MKYKIIFKIFPFSLIVAGLFFVFSLFKNDNLTSMVQIASVYNFSNLLKEESVILLDVRTEQEFLTGSIANSINIDFYSDDFKLKISELDRNKKYAVYCRSGNRSNQVIKIMEHMGFENIVELEGGIIAWEQSGKNLCTKC